jgi:hypothetical protein
MPYRVCAPCERSMIHVFLQSRMRRAIAEAEYGTSFAGMGKMFNKMSNSHSSLCIALARRGRRVVDLGPGARVAANWGTPVSGRCSCKPSCGCEWPATCLTTVVLSRTGWAYVDRSKGKIVDDLELELDSAEG